MSVTAAEYEAIQECRNAVLYTTEGKRALLFVLRSLKLFDTRAEWAELAQDPKAFTALILRALLTLAELGVLVPDNFAALVDAMSNLPMPNAE